MWVCNVSVGGPTIKFFFDTQSIKQVYTFELPIVKGNYMVYVFLIRGESSSFGMESHQFSYLSPLITQRTFC